MNHSPRRYVVGVWESLWPSEPYMSHRILIDLSCRKAIAGQDRIRRQWHAMSVEHVDYMQQNFEETYPDIFDEPGEYGFEYLEAPPSWALAAWPWPRLNEWDEEDADVCVNDISILSNLL